MVTAYVAKYANNKQHNIVLILGPVLIWPTAMLCSMYAKGIHKLM